MSVRGAARLAVWIAIAVSVACAISGCQQQVALTPIAVIADPASGHPCAEDEGLRVGVRCSGGQGPYTIDFGDGASLLSASGVAEHVYAPPFDRDEYNIRVTCDSGEGHATVSIENRPPVFYGIFNVLGEQADEKEMVILQVNFFAKGCPDCPDSCDPYTLYGGFDPDGDILYYEWRITREGTAEEDSVFDLAGNRVNGQAVAGDYFIWFPMWRERNPLFPFGFDRGLESRSAAVSALDKEHVVSPKANYYTYTINLTVSDYCGAADTYVTEWEILENDN